METPQEHETYAAEQIGLLFNAEHLPVLSTDIKLWLEEQVYHLLNHDFNKLVNILYRIDVYESKAKQCFGKQNKDIAKCLSELIWERQIEKSIRKNSGN